MKKLLFLITLTLFIALPAKSQIYIYRSPNTVTRINDAKFYIRTDGNGNWSISPDTTYRSDYDISKIDSISFTDFVTQGDKVDLGLSVKWASHNVGADKCEDYGGYFACGETEEKSIYTDSTYSYYDLSADSFLRIGIIDSIYAKEATPYNYRGSNICGSDKYDVARVKWGGEWRLPELKEIIELYDKCPSKWYVYNGVCGRKFTASNGNSIFLPAAGFKRGRELVELNKEGEYWAGYINYATKNTSSLSVPGASVISFDNASSNPYEAVPRQYGITVRPVSAK